MSIGGSARPFCQEKRRHSSENERRLSVKVAQSAEFDWSRSPRNPKMLIV